MVNELIRYDQDSEYRFEVRFYDKHTLRGWHITQAAVDYEDIAYIRDMLERLPPKMQKYIINMATLMLKAVEPLDERRTDD